MDCFRLFTVSFLVVLFASCSENVSIFGPLEPDADYEITTIAAGAVLSEDIAIPIGLDVRNDESTTLPSAIDVEIRDSSGTVVFVSGVEETLALQEGEVSSFSPDLADGVYTLHLSVLSDTEVVENLDRQFFVLTGDLEVIQTVIFPPTVEPASFSIAQAQLSFSDHYSPYARWFVAGELVTEGYWSDGAGTARFSTPAQNGVYELSLSIFPYGPDEGVDVLGAPPVVHQADLVVASDIVYAPGELGPSDEYVDLYHFRGNTRNAVLLPTAAGDALVSDGGGVSIERGVFGYLLDGATTITVPRSVFPRFDSTLVADLVLLPFAADQDGVLVESKSVDGRKLTITLRRDARCVVHYVTPDGQEYEREFELLASMDGGESVHFRTYLERDGGQITVSLSVDGIPSDTFVFPDETPVDETEDFDSAAIALDGDTVFGGSDGVVGILDEFGVRGTVGKSVEAVIREAYRQRLTEKFGERLVASDALVPFSSGDPYHLQFPEQTGTELLLDFRAETGLRSVPFLVLVVSADGEETVTEMDGGELRFTGESLSIVPVEGDLNGHIMHLSVVIPFAE